jgi:hypothetical protein
MQKGKRINIAHFRVLALLSIMAPANSTLPPVQQKSLLLPQLTTAVMAAEIRILAA